MRRAKIVYATRKSALALAQSRALVARLRALHPELPFEELLVTTQGDRIQDRSLSEIGGKGLFVKEIEDALFDGRADIAIHSLKDMPAHLPPGLALECIPEREDARDVAVTRSGQPLAELPAGARVGTSSLRRRIQLLSFRPDFDVQPLRGNVDTRLRKCERGEVDAILLARAGLVRLGLVERITESIAPELMLPAVGQGALAVEQREGDTEVSELLEGVSHLETKILVAAERGVMSAVSGNCQTPMAAYAERRESGLFLRALLAEPDGSRLRRAEIERPFPPTSNEARGLGEELGRRLSAS